MLLKSKSASILYFFALTALFFSCATNVPVRNVHTDPPLAASTPAATTLPANRPTHASEEAKSKDSDAEKEKREAAYELSPISDLELQKYAYELGFDPKKDLTRSQKIQIDQRKKLRILERGLDSQKERTQYSKVLPWLNSDEEKLEFLSIPSIEGRQVWVNKNKILARSKNLKEYDGITESQDIAVGMPSDYVRKSWGEPDHIEFSGNPIYKNERWKYLKQISTPQGYRQEKRLVYFEGGRVVGWETE